MVFLCFYCLIVEEAAELIPPELQRRAAHPRAKHVPVNVIQQALGSGPLGNRPLRLVIGRCMHQPVRQESGERESKKKLVSMLHHMGYFDVARTLLFLRSAERDERQLHLDALLGLVALHELAQPPAGLLRILLLALLRLLLALLWPSRQ